MNDGQIRLKKSPRKPLHPGTLKTKSLQQDYFAYKKSKDGWMERIIPKNVKKLNKRIRILSYILFGFCIFWNWMWFFVWSWSWRLHDEDVSSVFGERNYSSMIKLFLIVVTVFSGYMSWTRTPKSLKRHTVRGILFPTSLDLSALEEQESDDEPVFLLQKLQGTPLRTPKFLASPIPETPHIPSIPKQHTNHFILFSLYSLIGILGVKVVVYWFMWRRQWYLMDRWFQWSFPWLQPILLLLVPRLLRFPFVKSRRIILGMIYVLMVSSSWWFDSARFGKGGDKPFLIAHRGSFHPQNTLSSFIKASKRPSVKILETDLRIWNDTVYVSHDLPKDWKNVPKFETILQKIGNSTWMFDVYTSSGTLYSPNPEILNPLLSLLSKYQVDVYWLNIGLLSDKDYESLRYLFRKYSMDVKLALGYDPMNYRLRNMDFPYNISLFNAFYGTSNSILRKHSNTNVWVVDDTRVFKQLWCLGVKSITTNIILEMENVNNPECVDWNVWKWISLTFFIFGILLAIF